MALLTILGVTKKLYSYRLILERKIGKEVPQSLRLEFLEKFLGNNFTLSNAEDNNSRPKVPIPSSWEKMDSFVLLAYAGSFGSFKNPFATITSLSEFYFTFRKFILFVQTRKVIFMNYGSSISSWKQWRKVRFDLIFTMRVIYINSNLNPLKKFTSSSRSTQFNDILPWNISQMITKTIPITTRIVISYTMKLCYASCFEFDGKSMETGTTTLPEFPNGGKVIKEQIVASEERKKSKRAGMWERQSGIWVGELTIWVRWFKIKKIISEFTRSIISTRIG